MTSSSKERPILFSAPMVRALLDGTKTQTRRVVKITHRTPGLAACLEPSVGAPRPRAAAEVGPYGQPGDRLWVRETYFAWGRWETRYSANKSRDEWHFVDMTLECGKAHLYVADSPRPQPLGGKRIGGVTPTWWKRPAIFMPRGASRIHLEITDARVEHLLSISEADALAEGIQPCRRPFRRARYLDAITGEAIHNSAHDAYLALWDAINGAGSSGANPRVWAVSFRELKS